MAGSFIYNRLIISPGNQILLGSQGGVLLLSPQGAAAGAIPFKTMRAKVWHLLRENGPDNGFPEPGPNTDFPSSVVGRDLNIALAQFISDTGLAPDIAPKVATFPVLALLDYPLPADLISLTRIEYNPYGGTTYTLIGKSFQEYEEDFGYQEPTQYGQPYYYREPFGGYIRLNPQPGPGQANGTGNQGIGTIFVDGTPTPGDSFSITVTNGVTPYTVIYNAIPGDNAFTVATALSNALNASPIVTGPYPYLQQTMAMGNEISINGAAGNVFYSAAVSTAVSPQQVYIDPTTATALAASGDTMTFYYTCSGTTMVQDGDTPNIPVVFHYAPIYRVLADYWDRKNDGKQGSNYMQKYELAVKQGKAFTFDVNRSTQPTTAGGDEDDPTGAYLRGMW